MAETQTKNEVEAPAANVTMIKATPELVAAAYAAIQDGELPPEVGDSSITARAIQDRIKSSTSFDDVFKPQELKSLTEYVDEPIILYGFHLNPSSFYESDNPESGSAAYAVVEIGDPKSGDMVTVGTGGGNVLMQLVKAWEMGWFPFKAVVRVKKTRTAGRSTIWLEKA